MVLGTKKLSTKPVRMTPARTWFVFAPIFDSTKSAMRLSSPVFIIAAAMNMAAPTSASADDEKPASASFSPADVPRSFDGFAMSGAVPKRNAMSEMMMPDETGYETASVIQMMTEKIRMPIMRCPADERSGGVGSASTAISTRMAMGRPILRSLLSCFVVCMM